MTHQKGPKVVDVNELARGKVQEIDKLLESRKGACDLETFSSCFLILKQIITAADLHRTNDKDAKVIDTASHQESGESIYADYADDNERFNAVDLTEQFATNSVKWTIRVHAFKIVHQLVQMVTKTAFSAKPCTPKLSVLKFLPDLVRLSFVAATSPYDELKIQGFEMFRSLISKFSSVNEAEVSGHSIMEQYKTQIFSAIKPAFNLDAPPYITAVASQVCCLWICHGLEKDLNDIRRAYQLLLLSIDKLENQSVNQNSKLYTESELEQERVEILGSWAELYITAMEHELHDLNRIYNRLTIRESRILYDMIEPQVPSLVSKWCEAFKDYALLIMPTPRLIGTSHDNENVYTKEVALRLFEPIWPNILIALTLWLRKTGPNGIQREFRRGEKSDTSEEDSSTNGNIFLSSHQDRQTNLNFAKYVKFINGIIMKELCKCRALKLKNPTVSITRSSIISMTSLRLLLSDDNICPIMLEDLDITQEFYALLYSILILNCRDTNRAAIKITLDLIFSSTLKKLSNRKEIMYHGLAHSVVTLLKTMKDIEIACNEQTPDLDSHKMHLSIRLKNLFSIMKYAPDHILDEVPLRTAVVIVFQEILNFSPDVFVSTCLLEQLPDLYKKLSKEHLYYIAENLFKVKVEKISKLMSETSDNKLIDRLSISQIESTLKAMRSSIFFADGDVRNRLVNSYVEVLLRSLPATSTGEYKNANLIDFCITQIVCIQKLLSIDSLEEIINFELNKKLVALMKSRQEAKNMKTRAATVKKMMDNKTTTRSAAKITLRADFSNFYKNSSSP